MTRPLIILAVGAMALGLIGTPAWPWFDGYLTGHHAEFTLARLFAPGFLETVGWSVAMLVLGMGFGWWWYIRRPLAKADSPDPLSRWQPAIYHLLQNKWFVDELYESTVIRWNGRAGQACQWIERYLCQGVVWVLAYVTLGLAWLNHFLDQYVINLGFDRGCHGLRLSSGFLSRLQNGQVQAYLRALGLAVVLLVFLLAWGGRR